MSSKEKLLAKRKQFPFNFPFWARFKPCKNRTTLVINDEYIYHDGELKDIKFIHRESTSTNRKDYEKIFPNPDKDRTEPMYLKRPTSRSINKFGIHNKNLNMPKQLKNRYKK